MREDPHFEEGLAKQWLGAGEMVIVRWPADCNMVAFGMRYQHNSWESLKVEAAKFGISMWMRGRGQKRRKSDGQLPPGKSKYMILNILGPEGSVLQWYKKVRQILAEKRCSREGLIAPRKLKLLTCTNLGLQYDGGQQKLESADPLAPDGGESDCSSPSDDEAEQVTDTLFVEQKVSAGPEATVEELVNVALPRALAARKLGTSEQVVHAQYIKLVEDAVTLLKAGRVHVEYFCESLSGIATMH